MPGARRVGLVMDGLAAISSSQRVPRPRCSREMVHSVSPWRTTTVATGEGDARRGRVTAGRFGCTGIRSARRAGAVSGAAGCRRREKGSTRCIGAAGRSMGARIGEPRRSGTEGFSGTRMLAEGFVSGATEPGAASSGCFEGMWNGEFFSESRRASRYRRATSPSGSCGVAEFASRASAFGLAEGAAWCL